MKKGKILALSDSATTNTGYATIMRNILNGLAERGWECALLAHNYTGQTIPAGGLRFKDGLVLNFELIGNGIQPYCADLIEPKIREYQPDVFVVLLDTFMLHPWIYPKDFAPARSVFYFPSDGGGGLPQDCDNILRKFNYPIAMAKFGQLQALEIHGLNVGYIPHAVDVSIFKPVSEAEKTEFKKAYGMQNKFVVGTVARNQGRKMLDRTIKAFSIFANGHKKCNCGFERRPYEKECPQLQKQLDVAEDMFFNNQIKNVEEYNATKKKILELHNNYQIINSHENSVLFMHTDPDDLAQVSDLRKLAERYGVNNKTIFSGMRYYNNVDYKDMYKIYGLMDLFFLSTSGEGFGIPIIEAMSCEIPCIVTDYTTTHELLIENGRCGEPAKCDVEITGSWAVERGIMDIDDAAEKMTLLYDRPELRQRYGKVGRQKVLKYYDWNKVLDVWSQFFTEITRK